MITQAGIEIITLGVLISLINFAANKRLVDQKKLKEIRKRQKELQKELKKMQGDPGNKRLQEINKELLDLMKEQTNMSMKPLMYTTIPILIIIGFMSMRYGSLGVIAEIPLPFHSKFGWLGLYILSSLITTIILEIAYKAKDRGKNNG